MSFRLEPPVVAVLLAALLLGLNAWEAEAARLSARRRPLRAGRHDAMEVRLASWAFFVALLWLRASGPELPPSLARWLLPLGVLSGGVLITAGWSLARRFRYPALGRWPIAPYHGVAGWVLWIWGLILRSFRQRAAHRNGSNEPQEEGPTPAHQSVRDLASYSLEELMIPRSQVAAIEGARPVRDVLPEVRRSPHAIYPVYGDSVDQPLGLVRILDLAGAIGTDLLVRDLVQPASIVPETMKGLDLLEDLGRSPIPAALVADEFGGIAGLVTVEDLVEVLVGDLVGEHDVVRARILTLDGNQFRVEGTTTIEEFNERFGAILPEGEYETVAGLFLERVGRIPQTGDSVKLPGAELEVLDRNDRQILWLKVALKPASEASPISARPPRSQPARRE